MAAKLDGRRVSVGAFEGEHAWLVPIHEYGCTIPVTPRMRAYLHRAGIHLAEDTTQIVIPERSFLRAGHDAHAGEALERNRPALAKLLGGEGDVTAYLEDVGADLAEKIRAYARGLSDPPVKPVPGRQNGSPLEESGGMIESISYEVE